jgi:FMN phosphatase YigB (HAD superfamily)
MSAASELGRDEMVGEPNGVSGAGPAKDRPPPAPDRGERPLDRRLERPWELIERPGTRVLSLDIFDTLVWRSAGSPEAVFPRLASVLRRRGLLASHVSDSGFARLRIEAELHARFARALAHNDLEVTLAEIYAVLPDWLFHSEAGRTTAQELECALERAELIADLDIVDLALAAQRRGVMVIAVSDTYYSETELRELLDQPVLEDVNLARIFASCEYRTSKANSLFDRVLAELQLPAAAIVHVGDNELTDIDPPRERGIECFHFEQKPPWLAEIIERERRYEPDEDLSSNSGPTPSTVVLAPIRGKTAARTEELSLPGPLASFWRLGAAVYGPIFTGFAEWCTERAAELNYDTVHCFMREGDFLCPLIERTSSATDRPLAARPLWLNREVLDIAGIRDASVRELGPLLVRRSAPTVRQFLTSAGIDLADMPRFQSLADTRLSDFTTRTSLLEAIAASEELSACVLTASRKARDRVCAYLDRELAGQNRMLVVDLGWGATAQHLLRRCLLLAGRELDLIGLYLVTHKGASSSVFVGTVVSSYLADFGAPRRLADSVVRSPEVLEQICMPDYGAQVALDERLEPVFAPAPSLPSSQRVEVMAMRHGIFAFQREWQRYRSALGGKSLNLAHHPELVRPILARAVGAPTAEEATLLGSWHHDENRGSSATEEIAGVGDARHLRHMSPGNLQDLPMERMYWPAAVAARVDPTLAEQLAGVLAGDRQATDFAGELEAGPFKVEVSRGVGVSDEHNCVLASCQNHRGLGIVTGKLLGAAIQELTIRPSTLPAVVRIDYVNLRCWTKSSEAPITIKLEHPADFAQLMRRNAFLLNANVFVMHSGDGALVFPLEGRIAGIVFEIDVEVGFATIPIGELLPVEGRLHSVEEAGLRVAELQARIARIERSWLYRMTWPLRAIRQRLR